MSADIQCQAATGWLAGLRRRAARTRLPLCAVLELTTRCNLRCVHCYLGAEEGRHTHHADERDTASVLKSVDEWVEAGCLFLVITGGDPMVRADFAGIYRHACERGMVVTVFCDGILATDRIAALFREFPPRKVEISIYGATAETYERITRVPGSHARAWEGIRRLHANGVRVSLKTMVMTLNRHEVEAMAEQARALGSEFRCDAAIFPCLGDGSKHPLDLRVSPEEAVRLDMAVPEQRARWTRSVLAGRAAPESDRLYPCGAGATSFFVDSSGAFSPCLMTRHYRYASQGRAFSEIWHGDLAGIRKLTRTKAQSSFAGALRGACSHCPAFNKLETGDEEMESDYVYRTTRLRYDAVMATQVKVAP